MVDEPQKGSPAAEAGIESGDIITAVNGTKVKDARELARTIGMLAPNTKAKLDIIRQGQEKTLTVTIGEMSNEHQAKADTEQQDPEQRHSTPRTVASSSERCCWCRRQGRRGHECRTGWACRRARF